MQLSRKKQMRGRKQRTPRAVLWWRIAYGVLVVLVLVLFVMAIWYGTRVSALTISTIEVVGGETIAHDDITAVVESELVGTYYRLVPKRFAWTYPESRIIERIKQLPRVKNVAVDRTNGTNIGVVFEEYQPFALWCDSTEGQRCVFIDRTGYAFAEAPYLAGGSFLRYVDPTMELGLQQAAFEQDFVRRTADFVDAAYNQLGINIVAVEKTSQQELQYLVAGGGLMRTSLLESFEDTIENLATILQSAEFSHLEPGNFQYIDLRFGNKVFVNEELPRLESASSTAATTTPADIEAEGAL